MGELPSNFNPNTDNEGGDSFLGDFTPEEQEDGFIKRVNSIIKRKQEREAGLIQELEDLQVQKLILEADAQMLILVLERLAKTDPQDNNPI